MLYSVAFPKGGSVAQTITGSIQVPNSNQITNTPNRGLVSKVVLTNSGGFTAGTVGFEIYSDSSLTNCLYRISELASAETYTDMMPFWINSTDLNNTLYIKGTSNELVGSYPIISFTLICERFN